MTTSLLTSALYVLIGCGLLAWSANRFILGASAIANNFGVPPLVIGMALVGFATSFPEMVVSAIAALDGAPAMGMGNAIGSNIANIGLVLGISAIVVPLKMHSRLMRRELPILVAIVIGVFLMLLTGKLTRIEGSILFAGFISMILWLYWQATQTNVQNDPMKEEFVAEIPDKMKNTTAIMWLVLGCVFLMLSSRLLVMGAVTIAQHFGISELVIGLTIVSIGTSLPELAASITSALKGEHDIAVGNIIGSNMFNLLGVLAMPALIAPSLVPKELVTQDYPVMMMYTFVLILMAYGFKGREGRISRGEGVLLVISYVAILIMWSGRITIS